MQADKVGGSDQLVERDHLYAHTFRDLRIEIRIIGLNIEFHTLRPRRDLLAHVTQTNDAHRASRDTINPAAIAVQLRGVPPPLAVVHILVHAHEFARNRDEQADGLLRDFDGVAARGIANFYAELLCSREVHPIDTDTGAANDLGLLQLRDDFLGEGNRAVHDDPVRVTTHFNDLCIVRGPPDYQLSVDLIKDRLDKIDGNIVA